MNFLESGTAGTTGTTTSITWSTSIASSTTGITSVAGATSTSGRQSAAAPSQESLSGRAPAPSNGVQVRKAQRGKSSQRSRTGASAGGAPQQSGATREGRESIGMERSQSSTSRCRKVRDVLRGFKKV